MVDFIGKQVEVGDNVVFIEPSYKELHRGVISKITPKGATISWDSEYMYKRKTSRAMCQFMKVEE